MTDWDALSVEDMQRVFDILHQQFFDMKLAYRDHEAAAAVRAFVLSELGEHGDAPWETWFPLVASVFLYTANDGQMFSFGYVISAARAITGRPIPSGAPVFPGSESDRSWSNPDTVGTPPPVKRAGQPVVSPRCREWERPEYDVWQWDVMYDLMTRLKYLGALIPLELHPLPGIDPEEVHPPHLHGRMAFDFNVSVESRPPMGLVVASLLARELAYHYGYELSCGPISDWIFETVAGQPLDHRSRPPAWLEPDLEARFRALEPAAMLELCERAFTHIAEIAAGISTCDG